MRIALFFLAMAYWLPLSAQAGPKLKLKIKTVVFDIGDVLITLNHEEFKKRMLPIVESLSEGPFRAILDDFETGRSDAAKFRNSIRGLKPENARLSDEELTSAWGSQIGTAHCAGLQMIRAIRQQGFRTFALSTSNPIHEPIIRKNFQSCFPDEKADVVPTLFEKIYWTHHMGLQKPSPEIYRKMLSAAGLSAKETLFVDDSPENVLGAQQAGMFALLVTGDGYAKWVPRVIGARSQ